LHIKTVGLLVYFGKYSSGMRSKDDLALSYMTTSSFEVHGKNIQSSVLPSGPYTLNCLPSNVFFNINFA